MTNKEVIEYIQHTPYNTNPAILKQKLEQQDFENRADWNQNDPMALDYVKNRTHYSEESDVIVLSTMEMDFIRFSENVMYEGDNGYLATPFVSDKHYTVTIDGISYDCLGRENKYGNVYLGNYDHQSNFNSAIPFRIYSHVDADGSWCTRYALEKGKMHTIAITTKDEIVYTIDPKYIKDMYYTGEEEELVLCIDKKIHFSSNLTQTGDVCDMPYFVVGRTYKVILNNIHYVCVAFAGYNGYAWIGNPSYAGNGGEDNGMPFAMCIDFYDEVGGNYLIFDRKESGVEEVYSFTITTMIEAIHAVDPKYLPCDLMFKVGCTGFGHPKYQPNQMTKPIIIRGSLEAVMEKLANGEIPIVKVQYMGIWDKTKSLPGAYGGEFICDTWLYGNSIFFTHDIPNRFGKMTIQIAMFSDDLNVIEMMIYSGDVITTAIPIE